MPKLVTGDCQKIIEGGKYLGKIWKSDSGLVAETPVKKGSPLFSEGGVRNRYPDAMKEALKWLRKEFEHATYTISCVCEQFVSITCLQCNSTSRNPNDIRERYCGSCHKHH